MWRAILGVIVGFMVVSVFLNVTQLLAYAALGAEGAFEHGSWDPSRVWLITNLGMSFVAAVLGGYVCLLVSRSTKAPMVFAAIVMVLGLTTAGLMLAQKHVERPATRGPEVTFYEARLHGKQPVWVSALYPFIGAVGIIIGGRLPRSGSS